MKSTFLWTALLLSLASSGCNSSPTEASLDAQKIERTLSPTFHPVGGDLVVDRPDGIRAIVSHGYVPYVDPRTSEEVAQAACWGVKDESHPDGWRCGPSVRKPLRVRSAASAPIIPVAWTVSTWFFGVGGLDTNSCTSLANPCATFGEIETHRFGSSAPALQQPTTFTLLSGGQVTDGAATGQDWIFFEPSVANGSNAVIIGQLSDAGTFEAGPVSVKSFPDAGQLLTVQNMGSATPGGQLVFNVTRNSYGWTDKLVDAGTMTVSQPVPASVVNTVGIPTLSEDNAWAQGDTLTLQSMPKINLKSWRPRGGDLGDGGANSAASAGWIQNVEITDTSGTGNSEYPLISDSAVLGMTNVRVDPRLQIGMLHGRGAGAYVINTYMASANQNSIQSGNPQVYAGVSVGSFAAQNATPNIDGDIIFHGFVSIFSSEFFVGSAFCDNATGWNINVSSAMKIQGSQNPHIWGTAPIIIIGPNAVVDNSAASFVSSVFTTGALTFNGRTTGCFISGLDAGTITCNVPVTTQNIDSNQALFDENRGSRFALQ